MVAVMFRPTRTGGQARGVHFLCGLLLTLYLLLLHADHFQTNQQHIADHAELPGQALALDTLSSGPHQIALDCPVPNLLAPRCELLPDAVSGVPWIDTLLVALIVRVRSNPIDWGNLPRPPGPARQALLQRFTL